jgi:hypothetical protein
MKIVDLLPRKPTSAEVPEDDRLKVIAGAAALGLSGLHYLHGLCGIELQQVIEPTSAILVPAAFAGVLQVRTRRLFSKIARWRVVTLSLMLWAMAVLAGWMLVHRHNWQEDMRSAAGWVPLLFLLDASASYATKLGLGVPWALAVLFTGVATAETSANPYLAVVAILGLISIGLGWWGMCRRRDGAASEAG